MDVNNIDYSESMAVVKLKTLDEKIINNLKKAKMSGLIYKLITLENRIENLLVFLFDHINTDDWKSDLILRLLFTDEEKIYYRGELNKQERWFDLDYFNNSINSIILTGEVGGIDNYNDELLDSWCGFHIRKFGNIPCIKKESIPCKSKVLI